MIEGLLRWELLQDARVIARCQQELQNTGVAKVQAFVTAQGLRQLLEEISGAPFNEAVNHFTAFQDQGDERYQADHPRNHRFDSSVAFVGRQVLESTPNRLGVQLYEDPRNRLLEFLSRVAARQLFRSRDENGSVYSYLALPHHDPPWHFDESHFTAILYLQNSSSGGAFEFVPWSRPSKSKDDPRSHEAVRAVLMQGSKTVIKRVEAEPGSLVFFAGCHALHRAAPVCGDTSRIALVFTFGEDASFANSEETKKNNEWSVQRSSTTQRSRL